MGNPLHSQLPSPQARLRFGATLGRWMERGGWSSDLPLRWGKAAGFPAVADSTFSRMQRGLIEQPYPLTFIQFGVMNDRLHRMDYGLPADDPLVERLARQRPLEHEDGQIWTATDFFSHFIGELEAPGWAQERPLPSLAEVVELSAEVAERFKVIAKERQVDLPQAWTDLAAVVIDSRQPLLSRAELEVLRNVLSGWHVWTPEQLHALYDTDGELRPLLALQQWSTGQVAKPQSQLALN